MAKQLGVIFALLGFASVAQAYVGPGLGAGTLGVLAGLALSVFLALFAIVWYPFKRLLKAFGRDTGRSDGGRARDGASKRN